MTDTTATELTVQRKAQNRRLYFYYMKLAQKAKGEMLEMSDRIKSGRYLNDSVKKASADKYHQICKADALEYFHKAEQYKNF